MKPRPEQEQAIADACAAGYVRDPNRREGWYPGSPGLPEMRPGFVTINDSCRPVAWHVHPYGQPTGSVTIARFKTWGDFERYARDNGTTSRPGQRF